MQQLHDADELHYTGAGYVRGSYLDEVKGVPVQSVSGRTLRRWRVRCPNIGTPPKSPWPSLSELSRRHPTRATWSTVRSAAAEPAVRDPGAGTLVDKVDISIHAIHVIEHRLYPESSAPPSCRRRRGYLPTLRPTTLARDRPSIPVVGQLLDRRAHYLKEVEEGADRGDGEIFFPNGPGRPYGRLITSVKAGRISPRPWCVSCAASLSASEPKWAYLCALSRLTRRNGARSSRCRSGAGRAPKNAAHPDHEHSRLVCGTPSAFAAPPSNNSPPAILAGSPITQQIEAR